MFIDYISISKSFIIEELNTVFVKDNNFKSKVNLFLEKEYFFYISKIIQLWDEQFKKLNINVVEFLMTLYEALNFSAEIRRRFSIDKIFNYSKWEGINSKDVSSITGIFYQRAISRIIKSDICSPNQRLSLINYLLEAFGSTGRINAEMIESESICSNIKNKKNFNVIQIPVQLQSCIYDSFFKSIRIINNQSIGNSKEINDILELIVIRNYIRFVIKNKNLSLDYKKLKMESEKIDDKLMEYFKKDKSSLRILNLV